MSVPRHWLCYNLGMGIIEQFHVRQCQTCREDYTPTNSTGSHCLSCRQTTCNHCGIKFLMPKYMTGNRFCSAACFFQNRPKAQRLCKTCGVVFSAPPSSQKVTCGPLCASRHRSLQFRGEKHPRWRGVHHFYRGPNWHAQRARARKRANYTCQDCGAVEKPQQWHFDVDHIKPFSAFRSYRQANLLSNLRLLCRQCHLSHSKEQAVFPRFLPLKI